MRKTLPKHDNGKWHCISRILPEEPLQSPKLGSALIKATLPVSARISYLLVAFGSVIKRATTFNRFRMIRFLRLMKQKRRKMMLA